MNYEEFLASKRLTDPMTGLGSIAPMPAFHKPHQRDISAWALRRGRAAIFAGTGLGKTLMELEWCRQVAEATGKPVLCLAPLAVSRQHLREAEKWGVAANAVRSQDDVRPGISITNYQKLQHFDIHRFGGVCLDESSILKSVDGHYRSKLIEECASVPFRLAATATPAPNDFVELGNHAEFLGVMSYTDMLATFFTHDGGETQKWRLKGHAEDAFWKWMAAWAVMLRKPSDLGYDDAGYDLPPLNEIQHTVSVPYEPSIETGMLFPAGRQAAAGRRFIQRVRILPMTLSLDTAPAARCRIALGTTLAAERERLGPYALAALHAAHEARRAAYWRIDRTPTRVAYVEPPIQRDILIVATPVLPPLPRSIVLRCQIACSREFDISMIDIISARRDKRTVEARHVAMYLARVCSTRSLPEIARRTGDRDHTCALNAILKITARIAADPAFAERVAGIRAKVEAAGARE